MNSGLSTDDIRDTIARALDIPAQAIADDDDLIALGLDSIRMMKLAGGWRKQGFAVNFAELAADPSVEAWFQRLTGAEPAPVATPEPVFVADSSEPFPLAQMQHAFWIGRSESHELGGVAAHLYVEFDGADVDPKALEKAVAELVHIHPQLRAQFLPDGTQQVLQTPLHPSFAVVDLRDSTDVQARLEELREEKSHQRLRVEDGEVIDVTLSLLPAGRTRLHLDLDMLAADAMSYRLLMTDLAELYRGGTVAASEYTYRQYLASRTSVTRDADREWWQNRLADLPAAPTLPLVPESERTDPNRTVRYHHWLEPEAKARLLSGAHTRGITPAMALASVFAETIGRWSADQRFLLNLPLFQREALHPDVDRIVGDFTSSVMLDIDVSEPANVADRARALQKTLHTNGSHSGYSGLDVLRDLGRHRGEQVLAPIVYTSALNLGELFADSVSKAFGEPVWIVSQGPQVLLDAQVTEVRGGLLLNWDVRESAFPAGVVDAMFAQYKAAIDRLAQGEAAWTAEATPRLPIDQLTVRSSVNATSGPVTGRALHEGFFAHAEATPDAVALLWGSDGRLTYGELAARALNIAGALSAAGVTAGDAVAVQLPKGPEQIVAILGVLAAGGAYVPIGYDQPVARRAQILETAQAAAALCVDAAEYEHTGVPAVPFADAARYAEPLAAPVVPDVESVAYVIFTSGSTGTPKGVDVPHRAAMNTVDAVNEHFDMTGADRVLVISALEFDASVYDIFGLLSVGGSLVAMDAATRENPFQWVELINRYEVTILNCVPSMLDMLLTAGGVGGTLRAVLLGGDWVGADLPGRLAEQVPTCRFAGLGGATETAIHFSICEVVEAPAHWTAVPFGKPFTNVQCRVVAPSGLDCPDWVAGELWVGGAGVALGYRNDPDRTAERFVHFEGQNWYRTGDLARYWPDGTLEFLGRADHQVKIRGYRVELGEIEGALRSVDGVHLAVAVVVGKVAPKLAAAVTLDDAVSADDILAAVGELLPRYMVPSRLEILADFPLTSNGKLDRAAVQRLFDADDEAGQFVAPSTNLEKALAAIVGEVIGATKVGATDDFFSLGGDSVLATTLIARVREWLDAPQAVVADIFAGRNVAGLAGRLESKDAQHGRLEQVAQIYLEVAAMDEHDLADASVVQR
ncbi:amino acid adenylation domain-containing protein [Antrihabitans sp. YC2-6]|uniref:non-ribosomal peptide synthetase n=1 Tax=Antrihabitans sp. YC2-6 TaxID=2799498 RepID=UPI0027DDCAE2|nr:amino acid adenylation domain-containing protein [Antrihabitans sp. YC2-6]